MNCPRNGCPDHCPEGARRACRIAARVRCASHTFPDRRRTMAREVEIFGKST
jgi:hypothetical protein